MTEQELKKCTEECSREYSSVREDLDKAKQEYQTIQSKIRTLSRKCIELKGRLVWLQQQTPIKDGKK